MNNSMKALRVLRGMSKSVCIVFLLLTCCALSAQNEEHRVRNIVLVHGAWVDGSGWKNWIDESERRRWFLAEIVQDA